MFLKSLAIEERGIFGQQRTAEARRALSALHPFGERATQLVAFGAEEQSLIISKTLLGSPPIPRELDEFVRMAWQVTSSRSHYPSSHGGVNRPRGAAPLHWRQGIGDALHVS
jgi:hypothetical protein